MYKLCIYFRLVTVSYRLYLLTLTMPMYDLKLNYWVRYLYLLGKHLWLFLSLWPEQTVALTRVWGSHPQISRVMGKRTLESSQQTYLHIYISTYIGLGHRHIVYVLFDICCRLAQDITLCRYSVIGLVIIPAWEWLRPAGSVTAALRTPAGRGPQSRSGHGTARSLGL